MNHRCVPEQPSGAPQNQIKVRDLGPANATSSPAGFGDWIEVALAADKVAIWQWDIETRRITWSRNLDAVHAVDPDTFDSTPETYFK